MNFITKKKNCPAAVRSNPELFWKLSIYLSGVLHPFQKRCHKKNWPLTVSSDVFRFPQPRVNSVRSCYLTSFWLPLFLQIPISATSNMMQSPEHCHSTIQFCTRFSGAVSLKWAPAVELFLMICISFAVVWVQTTFLFSPTAPSPCSAKSMEVFVSVRLSCTLDSSFLAIIYYTQVFLSTLFVWNLQSFLFFLKVFFIARKKQPAIYSRPLPICHTPGSLSPSRLS